jgi:hypothetical protein
MDGRGYEIDHRWHDGDKNFVSYERAKGGIFGIGLIFVMLCIHFFFHSFFLRFGVRVSCRAGYKHCMKNAEKEKSWYLYAPDR